MYPPLGCHFRILFDESLKGSEDSGFQSISGLEIIVESKTEKIQGAVYTPLVLKRAIRHPRESELSKWLFSSFNNKEIKPLRQASIELLDEAYRPFMRWTIRHITPKGWKLGEMDAEKKDVLIETIELLYQELIFETIETENENGRTMQNESKV